MANHKIKAVFFDFMGTCLDWHTGVVNAFPQNIGADSRSRLALEWRQDYFDAVSSRLKKGEAPEDIDLTLRDTLMALLEKHPEYKDNFTQDSVSKCVEIWHHMPAWPEVSEAIARTKQAGYEVFVFANGTTRLQLDLCRSSGLVFNMLFSSALLNLYKPSPESYERVLDLTKYHPAETVMVAAHIYDLRGAKMANMKTVYIKRWTDDIRENKDMVGMEADYSLEDMTSLPQVLAQWHTSGP